MSWDNVLAGFENVVQNKPMYTRREGQLAGHDNLQLFFQVWQNPKAKGTIIICHGQGEHSESYNRLIEAFKNDPWSFYAMDLRGHGRSDGKRGYAGNFEDYCKDYHLFVEKILHESKSSTGPTVLLGHSLGGLIQLKTTIDHPEMKVAAQVCSSPLLGVAVPVPEWKTRAADVLNQWLPKVTLWNEITNDMLSRDLDAIREFEQDVLRHNRMSPGVFLGFKNAIEVVQARACEITLPTLFQIPENDPVVSSVDSQKFFQNISSKIKKINIYGDGARHEIYNDLERQKAYDDLKSFLDSVMENEK